MKDFLYHYTIALIHVNLEISLEIVKKIDLIYGKIKTSFFNIHSNVSLFSIKDRTYSYWNYVLQNVYDFKNPLFRPQSSYASEVLLPPISPQTLK